MVVIRDKFCLFCIKETYVSTRRFRRGLTTYCFDEKYEKLSSNYPFYLDLCFIFKKMLSKKTTIYSVSSIGL